MAPVNIPLPGLNGTFDVALYDPTGAPAQVIPDNTTFEVQCKWDFTGPLAPALLGDWHVMFVLDEIGGANEYRFNSTPVPHNSGSASQSYAVTISVDAATLLAKPEESRAYKAAALLTHRLPGAPPVPGPVAALSDLGVIQIYDIMP